MAVELQNLTVNASNGSFTFEVVDADARDLAQQALDAAGSGTGGDCNIQRIESESSNYVYLRDLASGLYVLYGYFRPFNGSGTRLVYDNVLASVAADDTGSHILTFDTVNSKVNFVEILVDSTQTSGFTYTRTAISLLDLSQRVAALEGRLYPDWSNLKWYVMGDSLTDPAGGIHTAKFYYEYIAEKTGIQIIVDGIGGTGYGAGVSNNQHFAERVKNIPADVDIVTIFGSVNDIRHAADTYDAEIYNTLAWLCLNRPGLRVIVVPPAMCKDYLKREDPWKAYCDRLQVCALACDFRYLSDMYDCPPFNPNFAGHQEVFFDDPTGIHPNEVGHKALAPYFYNALKQELALKL